MPDGYAIVQELGVVAGGADDALCGTPQIQAL
jgi:hypothetical protein